MILETSFLIDVMQGKPEAAELVGRIDASGEEVYLPSPALIELWVGVGRSRRNREDIEKIESLVDSFDVMVMTDGDAKEAGLLQARLSRAGRTMGTVDVMIAGMARARGQVLVTGDRDFSAVDKQVRVHSYSRNHR